MGACGTGPRPLRGGFAAGGAAGGRATRRDATQRHAARWHAARGCAPPIGRTLVALLVVALLAAAGSAAWYVWLRNPAASNPAASGPGASDGPGASAVAGASAAPGMSSAPAATPAPVATDAAGFGVAQTSLPDNVFAAGFLMFRAANQALRPSLPGASVPQVELVVAYAAGAVVVAAVLAHRLWPARILVARGPAG
jgi:hypothetical protein